MPTARRGGRRRTTRATTSSAAGWEPVFSGDENIIPGELLVTLSVGAADAMTESIPLHPAAGSRFRAAALGVDELDEVLGGLGAYDITRLAPSTTGMADSVGTASVLGLLEPEDNALSRSFRVRISPDHDVTEAAARVAAVGTVEVAEPNRWREATIVPDDPQFPNQWGLNAIKAPDAWDTTTGSPAVIVAVVDSGCDLDHPELAALLLPGFDMVDLGPTPTPKPGWRFEGDFAGRDDTPEDEVGHGTHVSGTIACASNNAAAVAGVNWQTRILPVKALTRMVQISDGRVTGVGSAADIAAAIRWAADHGAHVINMSLGSDGATTVEASAVAYAIGKGVVVVAAMGNDGSANPSFPAAYPGVVAVGAIDSADHRASFSQTGAHISVAAPGVGILSTYLAGGTTTMSGTSMASPHVAGVAALIKAAKPSATGAEIADILRTTARPLRDNPGDPVPNDQYGHGCVDAKAAVDKASGALFERPVLTVTPRLRTVLIACPPETVDIRTCVPRSVFIGGCGLPQTVFQPQCIPVKSIACVPPTVPPTTTVQTVRTVQTIQIGQAGAVQPGYDPYGLLGQQVQPGQPAPAGPAAPAGPGDTFQDGYAVGFDAGSATGFGTGYGTGYAAGYAAAIAQVQQTQQVAAPARAAFLRREPFTLPHSSFGFCIPDTVTSSQCTLAPSTIANLDCPSLTVVVADCAPFTSIRGGCQPDPAQRFGVPPQTGYDPYGQNPFGG